MNGSSLPSLPSYDKDTVRREIRRGFIFVNMPLLSLTYQPMKSRIYDAKYSVTSA